MAKVPTRASKVPGRDVLARAHPPSTQMGPPGRGPGLSRAVGGTHEARLRYYTGWRDTTHGTDASNRPGAYQVGGRVGEHAPSQSFPPYTGVSRKPTPERTDDEASE